jgi:D-alanine-D-alanine ligase
MSKKRYHITALIDEAEILPEDPNFEGTPPEPMTEYHVIQALRELGHTVSVQGVGSDLPAIVNRLTELSPDLIFNMTEQFAGDRRHDKNITSLLELLGIPFTGTGSLGMLLCRDKRLSKEILSWHKVRVPAFAAFGPGEKVRLPKHLPFPMIVKPALQDGSVGIANASVVYSEHSLLERIAFVHEHFRQPALAEEFIEGREFYVSVLGNRRLQVLPPRECFFPTEEGQGPMLLTYKVKWDTEYREKWNISFGFADLEEEVWKRIQRVSKRVFQILHLRDFARLDMRLAPDGRLVILEVNPNPDIAYGEEVAEAAEKAGIRYEALLDRIVKLAMRRYESGDYEI